MNGNRLQGKRVAVTGGAGFIGSHLVRKLLPDVAGLLVLDNLHRGSISAITPGAEFRRLDIRSSADLRAALSGIDVLFHLAAQSNVLGAVADLEYSFTSNVVGTYNVLSSALAVGVKRVVFTSSREVYGEPARIPVPENDALNPKNAYGASKAAGEFYCRVFGAQGLEVVVLRLANVYGSGDAGRVIPLFLERALRAEPLVIYGTDKLLDFVAVDLVLDALVAAATRAEAGAVFNIGSGVGTTIEQLAHRILDLTGSTSPVRIDPPRSLEVDRFVADITAAKSSLGYVPAPDPLSHLSDMIDGERRARSADST